ncbi:hypothetical protein NEOLEDRAFT_1058913 [Neolentinus lepideus HHB14362 ss-1]|uniref:CCHC-type domain-containing protein n=1 Tax=Neolentinus lepideus HHB14362 ss-1 TaxID=1314782 RepID=A0A165ULU7_9AGAM|nr:hypothetical protein NEOLEDRAFT_1058913 [Neolentinus lepideus HHB14362 ss-1]
MDVDRLSEEDCKKYMLEGKCFRCGQKGHRASDHKKDKCNYGGFCLRQLKSTLSLPLLLRSIVIRGTLKDNERALHIPIQIGHRDIDTHTLLDMGCMGKVISKEFTQKAKLPLYRL